MIVSLLLFVLPLFGRKPVILGADDEG